MNSRSQLFLTYARAAPVSLLYLLQRVKGATDRLLHCYARAQMYAHETKVAGRRRGGPCGALVKTKKRDRVTCLVRPVIKLALRHAAVGDSRSFGGDLKVTAMDGDSLAGTAGGETTFAIICDASGRHVPGHLPESQRVAVTGRSPPTF